MITVTLAQPIAAYINGFRFSVLMTLANTVTTPTMNLNAIGAKTIQKYDATGTLVALAVGDNTPGLHEYEYLSSPDKIVLLGSAGVSAATTSAAGIVQLATVAEAATGTNATKAVTPAGLYFPTGHLSGLGLTNSGADSIVIAAGTARSSDDTTNITLPSSLTKSVAVAWAVGTGNGGLDTGAVANTDYYLWLVERVDTFVVDAVFSTSGTAPTMPASYTKKALIGKFTRAAATNQAPRSYADDRLGPTAWVAYTPTFTGYGTCTNISFFSRRVGANLEVKGTFTSGTVTGTTAAITLGFNGTNGNVTINSTVIPSIAQTGLYVHNAGTAPDYVLATGGAGSVNVGGAGGSTGLGTLAPNAFAGSATAQSLVASIPISGW